MHIREEHIERLRKQVKSSKASFSTVYGRRRIGKTQMVNWFIDESGMASLRITGVLDMDLKKFMMGVRHKYAAAFSLSESDVNFHDWYGFFKQLENELTIHKQPFILFMDEAPWLAGMKKNGFVSALSSFWNDFAEKTDHIHIILCGSATAWIIRNVIKNSGPLYHRASENILLKPFTLQESLVYLRDVRHLHGITKKEVLEYYMTFGGVAFYLNKIEQSRSVAQNIQRICFTSSDLIDEYSQLFRSMFGDKGSHRKIVDTVATKNKGLLQSEILDKMGLSSGGTFSQALVDLEKCDFISSVQMADQKAHDRLYRIKDPFILFYRKWMNGLSEFDRAGNPEYWINKERGNDVDKWRGYAFENICHNHVVAIKKARKFTGNIQHRYWSVSQKDSATGKGAQIDLLLIRDDKQTDIVECKYSASPYQLNKNERDSLENKRDAYAAANTSLNAVKIVLIASSGVNANKHTEVLDQSLSLEDLFLE